MMDFTFHEHVAYYTPGHRELTHGEFLPLVILYSLHHKDRRTTPTIKKADCPNYVEKFTLGTVL